MSTSNKKTDAEVTKLKPTIFPLGFNINQVEGGFVIIDFIDKLNGSTTIIESIALSGEKSKKLAEVLLEISNNEKLEN